MTTDGGGWTVFQRRNNFTVRQNFFQDWQAYQDGFGQLEKEFWLGNHNLYVLTNDDFVTLRVDLQDFEGNYRFAVYKEFQISGCQDRFRLKIGKYSGDASDGLARHNNLTFVTYDDGDVLNCAQDAKGGWWYADCYDSNLNGLYEKGNKTTHANGHAQGIVWKLFRGHYYSLKSTEMKIRPTRYQPADSIKS